MIRASLLAFLQRVVGNGFLVNLLFLIGQVEMPEVPDVEQQQEGKVGNEDTGRRPLPPVEFPVGEGPQHRGREKGVRMQGDVGQDVQPPCSEFPDRSFQKEPHEDKHDEKDDETMRVIVELMDVLRNRRFRRSTVAEVGLRG